MLLLLHFFFSVVVCARLFLSLALSSVHAHVCRLFSISRVVFVVCGAFASLPSPRSPISFSTPPGGICIPVDLRWCRFVLLVIFFSLALSLSLSFSTG
eukprot:EC815665.1.p3 GENE.EC815665.1~~EC815665.1.p3  ORF type:complete len:98 (-),score=20.13 EC815665.1:80-373(-)